MSCKDPPYSLMFMTALVSAALVLRHSNNASAASAVSYWHCFGLWMVGLFRLRGNSFESCEHAR